jgi:hypothetical protein
MDAVLFLYGAVAFTPYSTELSLEAQIKAFSAELRAGAAAGAPDHLLLRLINTLCVLFMISMLNSFARLVALAEQGKLGPHQAPASPAPADPAAADPAAAERAAAERAAARRVLADWVPAGWVSAICAADPAGWAAANQDSEPADSAHAMASAGCAPAQQSQAHRNQAKRNEAQRNTDPADPVPVAPWPADRTRGPAVRQRIRRIPPQILAAQQKSASAPPSPHAQNVSISI